MNNIQDIFNSVTVKKLSPDQAKAFKSIRNCRTASLGSHIDKCEHCDHIDISYNSCRNRHCPICQGSKQHEWVQAQASKILPVGYFHIVFTLPDDLNPIIYQNQELLYPLMLKCAGDSITELAKLPKFLGAQVGATTLLHTWGQNLSFHPHIHCIVPGGGLSNDGLKFIRSSKKFFLPVKALSKKFRGKFLEYLKKAWNNNQIKLFGDSQELYYGNNFMSLINSLYHKDWVVHSKKPFKTPWHVLRYVARYTHRVAISNSRIVNFDGANVTFVWKDYRDKCRKKLMTLTAEEFVRRFLLHILPTGLTKIRHYGLLSSRNVQRKLKLCLTLAEDKPNLPKVEKREYPCPACGKPMKFIGLYYNWNSD